MDAASKASKGHPMNLHQRIRDWLLERRIRSAENRAIKCGTPSNWLKVYDLKVKKFKAANPYLARMKGRGE